MPGLNVRRKGLLASRLPVACEFLEKRVLFALAAAAGGSGYSGTLSCNTSLRKQQLICDPAEPIEGSTSVIYDASKVTLSGVLAGPGYTNAGFIGLIELRKNNGDTVLHPIVSYLNSPNNSLGTETGYAQVAYKLDGVAGQITPEYADFIESGGVQGVDTHAFFFDLRPGISTLAEVKYQIYAERADVHSGNRQDGLTTTDGTRLGPDDLTPAFVSSNHAPVITSNGGPYSISEGSGLTLSATATDVETPTSLTYAWDLNGDNVTDATGASPTLTATALAALGYGDGPVTGDVKLTVSDGSKSATSTATLSVSNIAPTVTIGGAPVDSLAGVAIPLTTTVVDPALYDTFTYMWSVNGVSTGVTTSNFNFTPTAGGTFDVSVAVKDDDGAIGTNSRNIIVTTPPPPEVFPRAEIGPDPAYAGRLALLVWGTEGADNITFSKAGTKTGVTVGTTSLGSFTGFGRMIARGLGGNDTIRLDFTSATETIFFGGEGNDRISAGNYQSILIGGNGNDILSSGNAKDLVVGGNGADTLIGGGGDDMHVADRTSYDAGTNDDINAWSAIFREWVSGSSQSVRQSHILGTLAGGLNGVYGLRTSAIGSLAATLFNDSAIDSLQDASGKNWLLNLP